MLSENGSSQLIIDGKIKLKNDSQIKSFTENGLLFENGSELLADVVVFCTGSVPYSNVWLCLRFSSIDLAILEMGYAKSVATKCLINVHLSGA